MSSEKVHFHYWGAPGRGEQVRLALHVGGFDWEDHAVNFQEYFALKAEKADSHPLLNLPYIQVGDELLSESMPLLRYVGACGNLIPSNPLSQLRMDQALSLAADFFNVIGFTFALEGEEQVKARAELCAGPDGKLYQWAQKVAKFVILGGDEFLCGSDLSVGDIALFVNTGLSPTFGCPATLLEDFPRLRAYRARVAAHPKVASRYGAMKDTDFCFKFASNFK